MRLWALAASGPALAITLTVAARATPGYSGWRDTVSRLGSPGQPWAGLVQAAFIAYGLLVWVGAAPAGRSVRLGPAWTGSVQLFAAAAIVAGLAPKDLPGQPHTTASQVHVLATVVGGAAVLVAMVLTARHTASDPVRRWSAGGAIGTVIAAGLFRLTWGSAYYGAIERAVLILPITWLTTIAALALLTARREPNTTVPISRPPGA